MPLLAWRKIRFLGANIIRIKTIIDFCKENQIDLICSNNYRVSSYAVWPAKFLGIPSVTIVQDFVSRHKLWKFNTFVSDLLVTVSKAVAAPLTSYFKKEVVIIYNGIDREALEASPPTQDILRAEFPLLKGKRVVGMVAQLVPLKRHKLFLEAMQEVSSCVKDVMFVVIGDSPDTQQLSLEDLKAYAQELKMEDKVIFTGSRPDVLSLLKSFDVLVHPADKEPFGRVIMEAMALGVPVVATASGGPSEIIENEQSGFLVNVGDKKIIVEKVVMLLKDSHLREGIGKKGKERISQLFNFKNTVCRFNDVFEKLMRGE